MASITNRITIHRPIEDVFAVLTDVEKTGIWFPGDVEEHWTTPPPRGVGSTRHAIVRMGGRRSENDAVVTEYDPPRRAAMAGTTPVGSFLVTLDFASEGDATHVEVVSATGMKGLMRIGGPIFLIWYRRAWGRGLETAKRMMEAGDL